MIFDGFVAGKMIKNNRTINYDVISSMCKEFQIRIENNYMSSSRVYVFADASAIYYKEGEILVMQQFE